ncbi:MAG: helix-turn-helix domain-containing protein [Promethearchaeota archaeon]
MISTIIEKIDDLLKKANFETLNIGNFTNKNTKFCFDLLVKKYDVVFSVKIFANIDNINPEIIHDIKHLSFILKSKPILIGIRNRYQKLQDNTIYVRQGLPFITLNTFEKILTKNIYPYILARRGGGVVFLDGKLMKTLREQQLITRKELSERLEVTKRTVSAYENESMRPSDQIAKKILDVLENSEIFKKINIFKWNIKYYREKLNLFEEKDLNDFESHLQTILNDIGLSAYWYKKGSIPFKLSLFSSIDKIEKEGFYPLFSAISEKQKKINEMNFQCLKIFNELFNKTALFIVNNDVKIPVSIKKDDIHIVKIKKLEEIDDEEEFIELIQES